MENQIGKSSSSRNSMWIQAVKTFCPKNSSLKSLFWKSLNSNEFHRQVTVLVYVNEITTEVLWDTMDTAFAKQRNNTFDRYQFSMRKQLKCQSVDFFGSWKDLANNCDIIDKEDSFVSDVFLANISDEESQQ